ncbi:MAG: AmmeMemoRadiSam system protein A [Burkholderiales bacterium]
MNAPTLPLDAGPVLLALARGAIARELGIATAPPASASWLATPGATFVTLMKAAALRGCIGSLEPRRALLDDVQANAVAAALRDPRFPALAADELPQIDVEVSLLSPTQALAFRDEADALAQLVPGADGVIFEYGHHRSTFLPQVWEQFATPAEFVGHLKYKAGLPPDFWAPEVKLARYAVTKWRESD